jgi:hypothetical protein
MCESDRFRIQRTLHLLFRPDISCATNIRGFFLLQAGPRNNKMRGLDKFVPSSAPTGVFRLFPIVFLEQEPPNTVFEIRLGPCFPGPYLFRQIAHSSVWQPRSRFVGEYR